MSSQGIKAEHVAGGVVAPAAGGMLTCAERDHRFGMSATTKYSSLQSAISDRGYCWCVQRMWR